MDTILWNEESDAYTKRAISLHGTVGLYELDDQWSIHFNQLMKTLSIRNNSINTICDIGCAYGAVIAKLAPSMPTTHFIGVDPGLESITLAKERIIHPNVEFHIAHSHQLPVKSHSIDFVILRMVMQWIPRQYLIATIAEIDRILAVNGHIYVEDFLPYKPMTSQSRHNRDVYIFKNDYSSMFSAFPWYREVCREVKESNDGEDYQQYTSIMHKIPIESAYTLRPGATVNHTPLTFNNSI